jgi:transcriptional regulator with PAS, ATPase and Fis domain
MNNLILILLIVFIGLLIVFIGLLAFFGNRFLKIKEASLIAAATIDSDPIQEVSLNKSVERLKEKPSQELIKALRSSNNFDAPSKKVNSVYCIDHPENFSNGKCSISLEPLCEQCLSKQGDMIIGRKYLDLFLDNEWVEIQMIRDEKEIKKRYMDVKQDLWIKDSVPTIIQGHFKINVETDEIEPYIVLFAPEDQQELVSNKFTFS